MTSFTQEGPISSLHRIRRVFSAVALAGLVAAGLACSSKDDPVRPKLATLYVTVKHLNGSPSPGAFVTLMDLSAWVISSQAVDITQADLQGRCSFASLTPRDYAVGALDPLLTEFADDTVRVTAPTTSVTLILAP